MLWRNSEDYIEEHGLCTQFFKLSNTLKWGPWEWLQ